MSDNHVTLTGNATRDPELRFTPSGAAVARFGLAVNRRWQKKGSDDWEEETSFFDVQCWSRLAENVSESVAKGARVTVTGRLQQDRWDDKDTGNPMSRVLLNADEVSISLKWATVTSIVKNERSSGGQNGTRQPAPPNDEWPDTQEEPF